MDHHPDDPFTDRPAAPEAQKRAAARHAIEFLVPGSVVGVGSGSTVAHFVTVLGERRADFPRVVSSSEATTRLLRAQGIDVLDLNRLAEATAGSHGEQPIDIYVDGADEVAPDLALLKGGGGALTREKIVAESSRRFVCIVDERKLVPMLGHFPLPVEVIPMARALVASRLRSLGCEPVLRAGYVTDNGNEILDAHGLTISDPVALEQQIEGWPGVVTVGLFARRRADVLLVAGSEGVNVRTRNG